MKIKLPGVVQRMRYVVNCAVNDWFNHRDASKGAALAFYTLFSMAPILVLVIAVAGTFFGKQEAQTEILSQLRQLLGAQGADAIQLILTGASDQVQGLRATVIATVLLLFGATSVFAELKASLDEIWELPITRELSLWDFLRTRLLSFGLVLVLAFLMMVSLVLSAALALLEHYWGGIWKDAAPLLSMMAGLIGFSVIATLFAVIYKMLPRVRLSWYDVLIGSLGTAALFTLGKFSIGLYIGNGSVSNSFGAAGSIVALLLWVYYSAQIFFLGAEFTRHYALHFGSLKKANTLAKTDGETKAIAT
ncbi:YihY/virulence factor BrkB family protein [Undibacterium seohonense]|uniref:YihY/virulence factor BrkB family protein n=1 Tax=Undibacterium seohonense TaxID=1344950 RepID=A0ABR6X6F7_9BURK|nr:YihY/virulence factor BrkB family protein [Undibacterium seohonense]MBC3807929.1 YihY/virulence factor BrkB family protein [Undibacterium seohonense]